MKKFKIFILIAMLATLLFGCSSHQNSGTPTASATPILETAPQESLSANSTNPFLQVEFSTDTVFSGSGKAIGTYGYITLKKSMLPEFSTEEFSDFFTEFVNIKVRDSGHNWVSIIFDDGTGFCFTGSNTIVADYGDIDKEGSITRHLGVCMISADGKFIFEADTTRSVPNPTINQEALVPDNTFLPVEEIIFSTFAEENGFGDTAFYVDGKVTSHFDMAGYDTIILSTKYGDIYISDILVPMDINEGEQVTVYFVYTGFSETYNHPCGAYVYHE